MRYPLGYRTEDLTEEVVGDWWAHHSTFLLGKSGSCRVSAHRLFGCYCNFV